MPDHQGQFEEFVELHGRALLRTAILLAGNQDRGQDLLQDALERCLRRWPDARVEYPSAYVRTTMVHLLQRRRLDRILLRGDQTLEERPAPGDDRGAFEDRQVLLGALRTLPPRQRSAVVLRYWEGYSEAETAEMLGCSVGTVKSQASRGLSKLREQCAPHFPARTQGISAMLTVEGELA